MLSTKHLSSALLVSTALVLTACSDPGPVAPNTSRADALRSPSLTKASDITENYSYPVTFTIPGGTCGLNSTVTGNGIFHVESRAHQSEDGKWHVSFHWTSHGTATGEDGSRYTYNYGLKAKAVDPTGPDDLAIIDINDHFNLIGKGKAPDVKVTLRGTFEFPSFNPIDAVIKGPGIACDPI